MARFYDTILGEYIKNPGVRGLGLDFLAEKKLDYNMIKYNEVTNGSKLRFDGVDLIEASKYSGEDVYITNLIFEKQKKEGLLDNKVLKDIEEPLLFVLKDMELNGVQIDTNKLENIGKILEQKIIEKTKEIYFLAGEEFNIASPKQVGEILFGKLGLPKGKKNKTGYSVNIEVLEGLSADFPIAKLILEHRGFAKLLSTYIKGLIPLVHFETGKIHTSYNQIVTATGRLSSTKPNLQNIPVGSGISGEIREAFIPYGEDDFILAFDYSQVEVRVLAIISEDEALFQTFDEGYDIHLETAKYIFGKQQITSDERKIAKSVNFGVIYGISPFGLSKAIGISVKEAKIYIDKFFEKYSKVQSFFEKTIKNCEKNGYVETMFGRKRYIKGINDRNNMIKKSAEREAINMPIQGSAADIIKIAMINVSHFLKKNKLKSKMIMQVHDELVFNVPKDELEFMQKGIANIMESVINSKLKLKVDYSFGKNWREAK